jgi:hypothetical protein
MSELKVKILQGPKMNSALSQINLVHMLTSHYLSINFSIILPPTSIF